MTGSSGAANVLKIKSLQISGPQIGTKVPDISERLRNVGGNAPLGARRDWPFVAVHVPWLFREEAECIACESGLSAQMKAEAEAAAAERHPSEVLSRATINCSSTGPDKHVILVTYSKVITYRPRRVAALDGA
jgi:hypothetical protein